MGTSENHQSPKKFLGSKNHEKKGILITKAQGLFLFKLIFFISLLPGCGEKKEARQEKKKKEKSALTFIRKDDCLNCHSLEDKSVGPSYLEIAQRYEDDFRIINRIADKIIEGGGGLWGSDQMSPHPLLDRRDARRIVKWILSLDDSLTHKNPILHTPSIYLSKVFQENQQVVKAENGLKITAFSPEQLRGAGDFPEIMPDATPAFAGVANSIHFTKDDAFQPLEEGFLLQAAGFIQIKQKGKYFFKLEKAGKGRVTLDDAVIINENAWDSEIAIDLEPGSFPILVEYLTTTKKNVLSLQWITPDDGYYRIIPEEVFLRSPATKN